MQTMKEKLIGRSNSLLWSIFILSMLAFIASKSSAQTPADKKLYRIWVKQTNSNVRIKGLLYDIKDSALLVTPKMSRESLAMGNFQSFEIKYDHINYVKLRKKGNPGKWFGLGFLAGFTTGVIRGFIAGDDPPCNQTYYYIGSYGIKSACNSRSGMDKAMSYGISYALLGGIVGSVIGAFKLKIPLMVVRIDLDWNLTG